MPVPTNRPTARADEGDLIYKTEDGKFGAVVDDIAERYEAGQPVLVGTISVEKSEKLSRMLEKRGIAHEVLNAKQHTREAEIVAQAGRLQGVTVATNMAGRGVDILLGGNPEILAKRDLRAEGGRPRERRGPSRARWPSRRSTPRRRRPRATRSASSAASTCSAPSATSRAASTTSSVAAPVARATRARAASTCPSRTT